MHAACGSSLMRVDVRSSRVYNAIGGRQVASSEARRRILMCSYVRAAAWISGLRQLARIALRANAPPLSLAVASIDGF